jgi:hypothetical protein
MILLDKYLKINDDHTAGAQKKDVQETKQEQGKIRSSSRT